MFILDLFKKGFRSQSVFKLLGVLAGVDRVLGKGLDLHTGVTALNIILAGFGLGYTIEKAQALALAKLGPSAAETYLKAHK